MGGNAFGDTIPYTPKDAKVFNEIIHPLLKDYNFTYIGSSRLKKTEYNDVDIAVEVDQPNWQMLKSSFRDFKTKVITPHSFSAKIPGPSGNLQFDFMQSKDLNYSIAAYKASAKSKWKGVHRNLLLMALIKVLTLKEFLVGDTEIRTRQHFDLYEGLVYMVQRRQKGRTGRFTTMDTVVLSTDFKDIVSRFLPSCPEIETFEQLEAAIFKYFYREMGSHSRTMEIYQEAVELMLSAKVDVPSELALWIPVEDIV